MVIIIKYIIKLTSGTSVSGDKIVDQDAMYSVVKIKKPKWYTFWRKETTNDVSVIKIDDIDHIYMKGLTDDEMYNHFTHVQKAIDEEHAGRDDRCECEDCEDCVDDGDVDPEETPNSYFKFQAVNPVMYG